jgi:hypothetical protein
MFGGSPPVSRPRPYTTNPYAVEFSGRVIAA